MPIHIIDTEPVFEDVEPLPGATYQIKTTPFHLDGQKCHGNCGHSASLDVTAKRKPDGQQMAWAQMCRGCAQTKSSVMALFGRVIPRDAAVFMPDSE